MHAFVLVNFEATESRLLSKEWKRTPMLMCFVHFEWGLCLRDDNFTMICLMESALKVTSSRTMPWNPMREQEIRITTDALDEAVLEIGKSDS